MALALGSLEERACVLGTATSPALVLQARTRRATEPRWKRSLSDAEGDVGGLAPAARVAMVEQDQRERSFSSVGQHSDSSSDSYSGRKEDSEGATE